MPVHDWTRVSAGAFHDFHCTWIPLIKIRLNDGRLPSGHYAQVEQVAGETQEAAMDEESPSGGIALSVAPPQVQITALLEAAHYAGA